MRRRRERVTVDIALQRRYWRTTAISGGCVMCQAFPVAAADRVTFAADLARMEGHHVVPKQLVKREGFPGRVWDVRNGMGLCGYHHARHENYVQRIPRDLVSNDAFEFADELGLDWAIDKDYP